MAQICIIVEAKFGDDSYMESQTNVSLVTLFGTSRSSITAQKMKFSVKDFFNKCDQIHNFLRIWSHLLKKFLMENFIFCADYKDTASRFLHGIGTRANSAIKLWINHRKCVEPRQTSIVDLFTEIINGFWPVTIFSKKLHRRCLIEFYTRL